MTEYRDAFTLQRITEPKLVKEHELVLHDFLEPVINKMAHRVDRKKFELPEEEVNFVEHRQIQMDAIVDSMHWDGTDAGMDAWIDAHTDELSIDPTDERTFRAREEEKTEQAQEDRSELLSKIIDEYNKRNTDVTVDKTLIGSILDETVKKLGEDNALKSAARSNNIDDFRKLYFERARQLSNNAAYVKRLDGSGSMNDVLFFAKMWNGQEQGLLPALAFHMQGVWYQVRR